MQLRAGNARRLVPAAFALATLTVAACGGGEGGTAVEAGGAGGGEPDAQSSATEASGFPQPGGRTLEEIAAEEAKEAELVVSPAGQVFHEGTNRLGFGVFTIGRESVPDAEVAIYAARPNKPAVGPFPATVEKLEPAAPFRSETTSTDPDAAEVVYRAEIELDGKGEWRLMALIEQEQGFGFSVIPSAVVGRFPEVPQEGEKAPIVHTPTADDVGGDLTQIDTRQPPSTLHDVDFAEVVGEKPAVLLFATPALCTSRVCGPVVDIIEQLKAERPDDASYIHMEIYKDNVVDNGLRPQVEAYHLPTEPWLFVVDPEGRVSTAIEGAFSAEELNAAIDEAAG